MVTRMVVGGLLAIGLFTASGAGAQEVPAAPNGNGTASAAAAAPQSGAVATVVDAGADGFGIRSADGSFRLRFNGVAQYDGRVFARDEAESLVNGFEIRRLRADLRGTVYGSYDFRVNVDYAGNRVEVLDAYLEGRFARAFQVRAGKFKPPVGLERLQSVSTLFFTERAFPTALVPSRDVGVQVQGDVLGGTLNYAVGVFNGAADGAVGEGDTSDSKDLAGRLFLRPFAGSEVPALSGLAFGVAGTIGEQHGTTSVPGVPALRSTIGRTTFLRLRGDGTAGGTVLLEGRRTRVSPQASWYWGSLGAIGEYVRSTSEVRLGGEPRELKNRAWQLTGSWVLTGEAASDRNVDPARPFDPSEGGWGAFQLAGRIQRIETDAGTFPFLADPNVSAQGATGYTIGLNWYLNRFVKIQSDYELTRLRAAEGGVAADDEHVFATRIQVSF